MSEDYCVKAVVFEFLCELFVSKTDAVFYPFTVLGI